MNSWICWQTRDTSKGSGARLSAARSSIRRPGPDCRGAGSDRPSENRTSSLRLTCRRLSRTMQGWRQLAILLAESSKRISVTTNGTSSMVIVG